MTPARQRRRPESDAASASGDCTHSADAADSTGSVTPADSTDPVTSADEPDSEGPQENTTLPADDEAARKDRARRLQAAIDDLVAPTPASPRDVTNASAADEARAAAEARRPQDSHRAPRRARGATPGTR
jgi:hypothetical protein